MKPRFALLLAALAAVPVLAAAQVGVSIGINQPGVYGRIDINAYPQPAVINAQPIIVAPPPVLAVPRRPIYLYVPPLYQQNWPRYCARYGACNQPVYFVQEGWVRERYQHEHPGWHERGPRDHDRDHGRRDRDRR
ncbi:hypothetical protein [Variovorax terrae]|uniref:Uncharacterized protein n=1 Tax=Variovorax terrae TaxID=2923278 RepID=A0A9X1VTM2_9BURK|nr:hypothetical protein [Variovorax terrae]MCJ0761657.1 hypothetical protein [Variovorax terrae]